MIIAVTLLICADIVGRSFFGSPVAGVAEIVSLSIVAIVFLQLGHAIKAGALARTDIFLTAVRKRSPRAGAFINGLFFLVATLLFVVLFYGSWGKLIDAWTSNEHVGVYGLFVTPV
jgi:TRAP-type mannitol/chloroaromatic compound transport system permease small subunit